MWWQQWEVEGIWAAVHHCDLKSAYVLAMLEVLEPRGVLMFFHLSWLAIKIGCLVDKVGCTVELEPILCALGQRMGHVKWLTLLLVYARFGGFS